MKRLLFILLAALSFQVSAQTMTTLPSGYTPWATQIYKNATDSIISGASGKKYIKLAPFIDILKLQDSVANKYSKSDANARFVSLLGSYTNPSWLTSLTWSKITSTPTTLSGYGITDAAPSSGGSGYIQNQTASPQSAAFYIEGQSRFKNSGNTTSLTVDNGGSQEGIIINNTAGGIGQYIENDDGIGLYLYNTNGANESLYIDNRSSADGITVDNSTINGTGNAFIHYKNGATVSKIDHLGNITGNSFVKTGGLSTQFLKADGSATTLTESDIPSLSISKVTGLGDSLTAKANADFSNIDSVSADKFQSGTGPFFPKANYVVKQNVTTHAWYSFLDQSTTTWSTDSTRGRGVFASTGTVGGIGSNDHHHDFQASSTFTGSGTLSNMVALYAGLGHSGSGTISNMFAVRLLNPQGSGTINNLYGLHIEGLTRGASNYAIYTAGTTPSYFGGSLNLGLDVNLPNNRYVTFRNAANTAGRAVLNLNSSNKILIGQDTDITAVGIGTTSEQLTITGSGVTSTVDVEITDNTKGIILKSPDGTRYRVTVANGGTLTVTGI